MLLHSAYIWFIRVKPWSPVNSGVWPYSLNNCAIPSTLITEPSSSLARSWRRSSSMYCSHSLPRRYFDCAPGNWKQDCVPPSLDPPAPLRM
ncbi:hypothetical protein D9M69_495570 [compost metagenome]